jgi:nucleotide-binding universal stress UspA family protein
MLNTILVAFDGSDPSRKAFDFGLDLAAKFHATLLVLGVIRLPEPAISVEVDGILERGKEHFADEFASLSRRCSEAGVDLTSRVAVGHPAEQILRESEDAPVDLIVMGRRGTTRAARWILGSVSGRVLAHAHCPVAVVK